MTQPAIGRGWQLVLLGAYHGINPGMGWLFAVALGMQERRARRVYSALIPIALGTFHLCRRCRFRRCCTKPATAHQTTSSGL